MGRTMWLKDLTIQEALAIESTLDTAMGYPKGFCQHYTEHRVPQTAGLMAMVVDGRAFSVPIEESAWEFLTDAQRAALIEVLPDGWIDDTMTRYEV